MTHAAKPVVLVPACNRPLGEHPFHVAGKKYIDAVRLAGALPLVVPSASAEDIPGLLDVAHGVLLTGSVSNVHPSHFGEAVHNPALPLDPARDDWTLPLIRQALARGMPLLGICRGAQETNVALGGSLHQAVQEAPGHADHRGAPDAPAAVVYGPAHPVHLEPGGVLEAALAAADDAATRQAAEHRRFEVNSVHGQGVKQLAPGLHVEARAPDGLVEAFSVAGAPHFALCVQWHPEWQATQNPVSLALFAAFGRACIDYRDRPRAPEPR